MNGLRCCFEQETESVALQACLTSVIKCTVRVSRKQLNTGLLQSPFVCVFVRRVINQQIINQYSASNNKYDRYRFNQSFVCDRG